MDHWTITQPVQKIHYSQLKKHNQCKFPNFGCFPMTFFWDNTVNQPVKDWTVGTYRYFTEPILLLSLCCRQHTGPQVYVSTIVVRVSMKNLAKPCVFYLYIVCGNSYRLLILSFRFCVSLSLCSIRDPGFYSDVSVYSQINFKICNLKKNPNLKIWCEDWAGT